MSSTSRAEDFLALVRRTRQGRLKLFIGPAPGVGKTYRMLQEAHRLRSKGADVVIGLIESHGRPETEQLVEGLPQVPTRHVEYRGVSLEELDVDAIIARRPEIVLVDEVAHTNAPGSRNSKRYLDVLDLLDAGINVFCALNIQHLESLNDLLARAIGVKVRETVPDSFVRRADQIVNIDLPAEDLLQRLREGKIYPVERIERALDHFFQPDKLENLRELALREVAEAIDRAQHEAGAAARRRSDAAKSTTASRLLVGLAAAPNARALLRGASRLAGRLNAHWFAVYVQTPREAPERIASSSQRHIYAAQQLAVELGAEVHLLEGKDVVATLIDFASGHGITDIAIAMPRPRLAWLALVRPSVAQQLLVHGRRFNLHVLVSEEPE